VLVLTTTEHADVTPTPGMTLLTGNGKLGSVGIRLVTEVSTPLMLSVVVSFSVVTPVQVAVPVTATLVALTAVFVLPVQFTVGRAGNAAAMAGLAPSAPNAAAHDNTVSCLENRRIISRASRSVIGFEQDDRRLST